MLCSTGSIALLYGKHCFALREALLCSCRSNDLYNCLCCAVCDSGKWNSLTNEVSCVAYENISIRISIRLIICLFWGVCKQFSCFNRTKSVNLHSFLIQQNCGYADKTV